MLCSGIDYLLLHFFLGVGIFHISCTLLASILHKSVLVETWL